MAKVEMTLHRSKDDILQHFSTKSIVISLKLLADAIVRVQIASKAKMNPLLLN